MKHKKGSARDRRQAERAQQFGPPGRPTQRQQQFETIFTHDRDTKRAQKADVGELERREFEPRAEGIIQQSSEPPGPTPERRR
jgi:hypothetical protein